ncbi:MAG TPA: hypothetical protein PLG65_10065, partial [Bacillota bacterium]|nr:hypothetical protein [Bacillota bacterium]
AETRIRIPSGLPSLNTLSDQGVFFYSRQRFIDSFFTRVILAVGGRTRAAGGESMAANEKMP